LFLSDRYERHLVLKIYLCNYSISICVFLFDVVYLSVFLKKEGITSLRSRKVNSHVVYLIVLSSDITVEGLKKVIHN
jgi:uncharacterized protein YifN (PemK superfamily)